MQDNPTPKEYLDINELAKAIQDISKELEELKKIKTNPKPYFLPWDSYSDFKFD